MLKRIGLIGVTAAAATFLVVACGENLGTGNGGCSSDSDCQSNEVCHPDAKVCLSTCSSSADCPDSAKTCAAIGNGNSAQICKCSTDQLCDQGKSGQICSTAFNICINKCGGNSDCPSGFTCDTGNGQCTAGGNTDAGTDAGNCGWENCSTAAFTGSDGQQCGGSGCATGPTCSGVGRTSCDYGSACFNDNCGFPPRPTSNDCQNFFAGDHAGGPIWTPNISTQGPVIYLVEEISHGTGTAPGGDFPFCNPTDTQWNVRVRAYNPAGWPATRGELSGFFYVPTGGNNVDILGMTLLRPSTGYNRTTGNNNDAEFQINVCSSATNAFQPGFFFTNGNEACRQL